MSDELTCEASATKAISELFPTEQLSAWADNTIDMIAAGKPRIDGQKEIAACHFYETDKGKVGTFSTWVKGTPFKIYIGLEAEINEMKSDFYKIVEETGLTFKKNPKERAKERKRERKKRKK